MKRRRGKSLMIVILIGVLSARVATGSDEPEVEFRVSIYSHQVIEAAPVLASLFLKNQGRSDIFLPFSPEEGDQIGIHTTLMLTDETGRIRTVQYEREGAPPLPCGVARFFPLRPGCEVVGDYVIALVYVARNDNHLYNSEIAPPGRYAAQFRLRVGGGVELGSNKSLSHNRC